MTNPTPQIEDTARRVVRTVIQVATGVVAFAGVYPLIVQALGIPEDSNVGAWLGASVVVVGAVAAAIARIMAIPAVNTFLGKIRLAGHSGDIEPEDTQTKFIAVVQQPATSSGEESAADN